MIKQCYLCNLSTGGDHEDNCPTHEYYKYQPTYKEPEYKMAGWRCPKCWRGLSPFVTVCPCGPEYVTWTDSTTIAFNKETIT